MFQMGRCKLAVVRQAVHMLTFAGLDIDRRSAALLRTPAVEHLRTASTARSVVEVVPEHHSAATHGDGGGDETEHVLAGIRHGPDPR